MASTIFITPAAPAAAWVCPRLDFTEPTSRGRSGGRCAPYASSSAPASIGSPSFVPVPCASTTSTSEGCSRASASAETSSRCCAAPLGAVSPLLAPSELTADPAIRASTGWPLRRASEYRSTRNIPPPSAQTVPSASSANGFSRASGASPPWRLNSMNTLGDDSTVTPPARASEHSPRRSAAAARCSATSDDEHAVSIERLGPCRPSANEIRPEATLVTVPIARCGRTATSPCPGPVP